MSISWHSTTSCGPDLGVRFLDDFDRIVGRIEESPRQFPVLGNGVRRALLGHFPYGGYFLLSDEEAQIIAVLHLHGHADTWRSRLPEPS